ncbi:uncharacterized protein LOC144357977 [Saccoglossus kowalevskii]
MEFHLQNLRKLCRLCGGSNAIPADRQPVNKDKFSKDIQHALHINVSEDDGNVHPPFICGTCRIKLVRWKKKKTKKELCLETLTFHSHSLACKVCFTPAGNEKQDVIESVVKSAKACQFTVKVAKGKVICIQLNEDFRQVAKRVEIHVNGEWSVEVHGKSLTEGLLFETFPARLDTNACRQLLSFVDQYVVCVGNPGFESLCRARSIGGGLATFSNSKGGLSAYEEKSHFTFTTVRHVKCQLFVSATSNKCSVCRVYKRDLASMTSRDISETVTSTSIFTRNDRLSSKALQEKADNLQRERKSLKRKISSLTEEIQASISNTGEQLGNQMSDSFVLPR